VVPDAAAGALARALEAAEPALRAALADYEERRAEELDRALIKNLQRAFRGFYRQRPRYSLLPVESGRDQEAHDQEAGPQAAPGQAAGGEPPAEGEEEFDRDSPPVAELFPPGPLAEVRLTPAPLKVECGGQRGARARALDAAGRTLEEPVTYRWRLDGPVAASRCGSTPRACC
jgi:hypothetical protein